MQIVSGHTYHKRYGDPKNAFRYGVDYVLINSDAPSTNRLFSRNSFNLAAVHDADYGGPNTELRGAAWARHILDEHGFDPTFTLSLLTQPKVLGYVFNPVSFWLVEDAQSQLRAVIAEVNNTYGGRHSYICAHPDHRVILPADQLVAPKALYVSPFQPVSGEYWFNFDVTPDQITIRIDHRNERGGVLATLQGKRQPLTSWRIIIALVKRPIGSLRVITLIHFQALKLWMKKQTFRNPVTSPSYDATKTRKTEK